MHTAELRFAYASPAAAALVEAAVGVELGEIDGDRAEASLRRRGETLEVDIEAQDLVALRAGLNTWQTLLEVAGGVEAAGRIGDRS